MPRDELDDLISDFSRFYILTILYEGTEHGYSILRKFEARVGKKISPGLVYPFLARLEDRNLISVRVEATGDKERKLYTLTPEGKALCERLFRRFAGLVSIAIEPSMEVCAHCGCKLYEGGYREVIDGRELFFCCVHCAATYKASLQDSSISGHMTHTH